MNVANARWFGSRLYFSKTSRQPRRLGFWLRLYLILEFWHQIVDDSVAFFNTHWQFYKVLIFGNCCFVELCKIKSCWFCVLSSDLCFLYNLNDFISVIWVRRNSHSVCIDASGSNCVWFRAIAWGLVIEETLGFKKCALDAVLYTVLFVL